MENLRLYEWNVLFDQVVTLSALPLKGLITIKMSHTT